MLKITQLTMKNFLSVGNVTQAVKLDDAGLTLVLGTTTDSNGGITRNGAGKSSILQAVSFGLYGKPLTKIKIGNLTNNINNRNMLVTIDFESDGVPFRIERGKKPDVMRLFCQGTEVKTDEVDDTLGDNRLTQHDIDRIIGMSHTMFKHIIALNTFTDPFLKLNAADQRAIIEELLGVTQLTQRAEALGKLIKTSRDLIRDEDARIKATIETNSRIDAAIKEAEKRLKQWEDAHRHRISTLEQELNEVEEIDFEAEVAKFDALDAWRVEERKLRDALETAQREVGLADREHKAVQSECARLRRDLDGASVETQVARLVAEQKRKLADIDRHNDAAAALAKETEQSLADIANADDSLCVCCGQTLQGTDHLKTVVEKLTEQADQFQRAAEREAGVATSLRIEHDSISDEITRLRDDDAQRKDETAKRLAEKEALLADLECKVNDWNGEAFECDRQIKAMDAKPKVCFASRDEVYRVRQARETLVRDLGAERAQTNPHGHQIDGLRSTLQEISYDELNRVNDTLKHQDFLLKLLSNKELFIRKKIIDQNLSHLNSRLNIYLDKFGLPHEVQFRSDLSVDITSLGRDFDFEQLSRGEMNRVIMSTSWAFRDVWESLNSSCNLLWVDELLDQGMDLAAVEAGLSILKGMARDRGKNVFLISHREELQARIDRTLLVRKENGFTVLDGDVG